MILEWGGGNLVSPGKYVAPERRWLLERMSVDLPLPAMQEKKNPLRILRA